MKPLIGGIVAGVLLPVLSFGITPAREMLLGLAPDEQILQLADTIDSSRVANETKLAEFQSTIEAQQAKLAEQQQVIDEQTVKVEKAKADMVANNIAIDKNLECSKLTGKYGAMCGGNIEKYDIPLTDYLKQMKKNNTYAGHDFSDDDENVATKNYQLCKNMFSVCN